MVNAALLKSLLTHVKHTGRITYVGVGTDRNILDSLGPLVGTMLEEKGYKVYGTVDKPMHALTLPHHVDEINDNRCVIAIDACVAVTEDLYTLQFRQKPVKPGAGSGKVLPHVGHYSILGMVDKTDVIENLGRLHHTIRMAKDIVDTIERFEQIRNRRMIRNKKMSRSFLRG